MAHLKKSATTGHLLKTGTGHLSKACGATVTCCSAYGCCFSDGSFVNVTTKPVITFTGNEDQAAYYATAVAVIDWYSGLDWSNIPQHFAFSGCGAYYREWSTAIDGFTVWCKVTIGRNATGWAISIELYYEDEYGNVVFGTTLATAGCCSADTFGEMEVETTDVRDENNDQLVTVDTSAVAIVVANNKCCECDGGGCVPTSDGSDSECVDGEHVCTGEQDGDCPP